MDFEILGALADWIGIDLRSMSVGRRVLAVLFYSVIGIALVALGVAGVVLDRNDAVGRFAGAVCALVGVGWLTRITWNVVMLTRKRRDDDGHR